ASLAKAFAGRAGIICCSEDFKDYFAMESYPAIFSSCLLDHELAWFSEAADFLSCAEERRNRLRAITARVRSTLSEQGYDVSAGSEQIIALEPGHELLTLKLRDALQARGIFGAPFCLPATGLNRSLIRLSMNSGMTEADVAHLLEVCAEIRDDVSLKQWWQCGKPPADLRC
ncbi:MAG: aminotransferase class I/II-fold pyridoxal phosphate-dependent enzyme, partial [Pseudomonas sp.]